MYAVDRGYDLNARVLIERLQEAGVAIRVGRVTGEAAHVVDDAFTTELLEQPACT